MNFHTILLVNDDRNLQQLLERYVSEAGFRAASVETAQEAVVFLRLFEPDIIFVNMHLKDMAALPLLRRVKENPRTQHISVVIVALFHTCVDLQPFLAARAGGFLLLLSGETEQMMAQIRKTVELLLIKHNQTDGHRENLSR